MKKLHIILLFFMLLSGSCLGQADSLLHLGFDNTYLYLRYAYRQDLTVAQLIHFPVDSNMYINGLMLQANDDEAWERLLDEFVMEKLKQTAAGHMYADITFRDKYDPTKPPPMSDNKVDKSESCIVIVSHKNQTVWVFNYNDQETASVITRKFLFKQLANEK